MVYDKRTLVEAIRSVSFTDPEPTDEQLLIAYADVDYEELRRSSSRLQQYAGALATASNSAVGPMPSDIQLALRSITDAFGDVVVGPDRAVSAVSFASEWTAEDEVLDDLDDPALTQEDLEGAETLEQDEGSELEQLEETVERRWSDDARMRLHWRNFIGRFLRGLESSAWQELVGTAVLSRGTTRSFPTCCRDCTGNGGSNTSISWNSSSKPRCPPTPSCGVVRARSLRRAGCRA